MAPWQIALTVLAYNNITEHLMAPEVQQQTAAARNALLKNLIRRGKPPVTTPRMRTAEGALEIIKAEDPETAVTLRYIRRLIATGEVNYVPVGRKKLINVNKLLAYLENGVF